MEYHPQVHQIHKSKSRNLDQDREITADVSVDSDNSSESIYVLSDRPPCALPTPVVAHPSTRSTYAALSPPSRLMPSGGSEDSKAGAILGSMDDTHDWDCVRSALQRLSATNTGATGNSECSIEEWDCTSCTCTPRDILPLDESESSPALDGDAFHAHRWDTVIFTLWSSQRETHTPCARPSARVTEPPEQSRRSPHPAAPAPPPASYPRIRLPLLSIFVSLPSIDNATLHPVARSPTHSASFPGAGGSWHPCLTRAFEAAFGPSRRSRCCM